jgi:hypothetical protein
MFCIQTIEVTAGWMRRQTYEPSSGEQFPQETPPHEMHGMTIYKRLIYCFVVVRPIFVHHIHDHRSKFRDKVHHPLNSGAALEVLSDPYENMISLTIDVTHMCNLRVTLPDVPLVNAESVYPQCPSTISETKPSQSIVEFLTNMHLLTVAFDMPARLF